jgi:hypothetical protein
VPKHPASSTSSTSSSSSRQGIRKPPPLAGSCSPLWQSWVALLLSTFSQRSLLMQLLPLHVN